MAEKKKGLIARLTMGRDDNPDFTVDKLPGTRWQVFKDILKNRKAALFWINLLMLLFCLPAIAWTVLIQLNKSVTEGYIGYSANMGFGYYPNPAAELISGQYNLQITIFQFAVFIPLLMIAAIGLAGGFHTIKMLVWGEGISVASTFFKGIKNNITLFLLSALFLGAFIFLVMFNFASLGLNSSKNFIYYFSLIATIITSVILLFMTLYLFTQSVTYKIKFKYLIKNSFLLALGMLLQNVVFVGITVLPFFLMLVLPVQISAIFIIFYIVLGISISVLIWTIYAHYVFDKFINDKIEGAIKDRGIYRKSKEETEKKRQEMEERRKKSANTRYANPKKKKATAVSEDVSFTPLSSTFSRRDIERMTEERKKIKEDADTLEAEDVDDQTADTNESTENTET